MSDPALKKVTELCDGYPPEFNAGAVYKLVVKAWQMGFDIVKAPAGSNLYRDYVLESGRVLMNYPGQCDALGNMMNALNRSSSKP